MPQKALKSNLIKSRFFASQLYNVEVSFSTRLRLCTDLTSKMRFIAVLEVYHDNTNTLYYICLEAKRGTQNILVVKLFVFDHDFDHVSTLCKTISNLSEKNKSLFMIFDVKLVSENVVGHNVMVGNIFN